MNLANAKALALKSFPEFSSPEAITSEGLVRIYSDFAICLKVGDSFQVYSDGILLGESDLSPKAAWEDAAFNLPPEFLDSFNLEFAETSNYFTKEEHNDRSHQEENQTPRNSGEAFGRTQSRTPRKPSPAVVGSWGRNDLLRY